MNRYDAPNHPDCFVDCDGDGWALYTEKYGPCDRHCAASEFARSLAGTTARSTFAARVSGRVVADAVDIARGFDDQTFDLLKKGARYSTDYAIINFFKEFVQNFIEGTTKRNVDFGQERDRRLALQWYDLDI